MGDPAAAVLISLQYFLASDKFLATDQDEIEDEAYVGDI